MTERRKRSRGRRRASKDRVLQARIPEQLDDVIRDRAESLGLSVSTTVRNALLHTFDLVEGVVSDSVQISKALQGQATLPRPEQLAPAATQLTGGADIVGWQEAILNLNGVCDQCNAVLHKGERAAVGLPTTPRPVLQCLQCLEDLPVQNSASEETEKSLTTSGSGKNPKK